MIPARRQFLALACALVLANSALIGPRGSSGVHAQARRHTQLLLVIDGLRPDYITPQVMPRLHALGARGIVFTAHHSVFPTVTRVNASSMSTGTYPESHGLLGNTIYSEKAFPGKGLNTADHAQLLAMERAEGDLLTAPTLGSVLQRAGRRFVVISAGSSGSALLLNHPVYNGAVINPDFIDPPSLATKVTAVAGKGPAEAVPNNARNKWAVDVYLSLGLGELNSDVTAIWFGDPDATAHQKGIGSETTIQALRYVDAEIGRIEDTLKQRGLLDTTNIIVASDHGFSTQTGTMALAQVVAPFSRVMPDGARDIVVTEGAINFRGAADPARVKAIVGELQRRPEIGAIFTRPASPGSMQGVVPGTLSHNVARWNHARASDIMVSGNWTEDRNPGGFPGQTTQGGVAGHGTSSPYDIHNTFMAAGPDFRAGATSAVPTSNADLAPTILRLLGLQVPASMNGRAVEEGLTKGATPGSVNVTRSSETASTPDGSYEVIAHISTVNGHRYLDFTDTRRR